MRQLQEEGWEIDHEDLAPNSPYLTERIRRFGEPSTHEPGLRPEAYDPHLEVGFSSLRGDGPPAPGGCGRAAPCAHRLSAARAISAGSAPCDGRGPAVQRWPTGVRLPRPVPLGLGVPFARPGRALLTVVSVLLGVATVTLATGLSATMVSYGHAEQDYGTAQSTVWRGQTQFDQSAPHHNDAATQNLLRSLPHVADVAAVGFINVRILGRSEGVAIEGVRGGRSTLPDGLARGRWMRGPDEVVASGRFLAKHRPELVLRFSAGLNWSFVRAAGSRGFGYSSFPVADRMALETWPPGAPRRPDRQVGNATRSLL
ncbi:ABC transporter permease [Streptomyces yokosukanensis]|uniref:ABC transporter permease n=1 Tax=Streptomyces yokosukanensis TaxID=67386 RepID=UPI0008318E65|nr:ABC transporter permease [Streptomyces yokosukanensis]